MTSAATFRVRLRSKSRTKSKEVDTMATTKDDHDDKGKVLSASAKSMRKKRKLLKQDPIAWARYKENEAERHRNQRKNRNEEQKARDRVTAKARSNKHYAKQKVEGTLSLPTEKKTPVVKILTRAEKKNKRQYNKEKQRICRSKKTPQQKVWDRKKDRDKKRDEAEAKKQLKYGVTMPDATVGQPTQGKGFRTPGARRTAVSRIWAKMPSDAEQFAEIVSGVLNSKRLTPRKRNALGIRGLDTGHGRRCLKFAREGAWSKLKGSIQHLKGLQDDKSREKRAIILSSILVQKKYRAQKMLAKDLELRPNYLANVLKRKSTEEDGQRYRKKRADVKCIDVVNSIKDFYRSPLVSREMPTMRSVKNDLMPRRVMEVSCSRAYESWKSETKLGPNAARNDVCSLSLFMKLRPNDVLLQHKHKLMQCLCEYCTDTMLKLLTLNRTNLKTLGIKDKYLLISSTLCPAEEGSRFYHMKCVNRNCKDCGVELLRKKIEPLLVDHLPTIAEEAAEVDHQAAEDVPQAAQVVPQAAQVVPQATQVVPQARQVSWRKWDTVTYTHNNQTKSKKALQEKTGSLKEMVDELLLEAEPLAKHVFVADWQQSMFSSISKAIPEGTVLLVLDFAENYSCFHQDEIQSAHWAINQVTVHPVVAYYNCPDHNGDHHVVQEAVVIISNDIKHDAHAVQHFVMLTLKHLREKRGVMISKVVEFTDGCAGQYKSKLPFADLSFSVQDLQVERERHFFGSRHGKGPSDGVSGVVKSGVRRAVIARRVVVDNAAAMFAFCHENMTKNDCAKQRRVFIYVAQGEINRDRPNRAVKTAVVGTRSLQAVKGVEPGVVAVRLLSCFCDGCRDDETCVNSNFTHPWQTRALKLEIPHAPSEDVEEMPDLRDTVNGDGGDPDEAEQLRDIWESFTKRVAPDDLGEMEPDDDDGGEPLMSLLEELGIEYGHAELPNWDVVVQPAAANGVPTYHPGTEELINITPEKFYAVFYTDPPKWFIGRVVSMCSDDHVQVNFLEQKPEKGSTAYWWPKKRDEEKLPRHFIFYGPLNMSGHHLLTLTEDDEAEINNKFKNLKKIWK